MRRPLFKGLTAVLAFLALAGLPAGAQRLFWETPRVVVPSGARFPAAAAGGGLMVVVWQEFVQNAAGQREVWLTARSSRDARQWNTVARFAGPFPVQERETPIFSLAVDGRGGIWIAAAAAERRTSIFASRDGGRSFAQLASVEAFVTSVAPSLHVTSRGDLLLFATQESGTFLSLRFALSRDGSQWTPFQPLVRDEQVPVNFLAQHVVFEGRDYVVCQTLRRGERRYQLQIFSSPDGGYSWSEPRRLEFGETVDGRQQGPELFSNQRPFLATLPDRLGLVWERQFQARPARVYYLELDGAGNPLGQPQAVTDGTAAAYFPRLVRFRERSYVFYFSGADRVYAAEATATGWTAKELNELTGSSYFAYPVELDGRLFVFWENRVAGSSRLIVLEPDQSVEAPRLAAVNFSPGQASRQELVQVRWSAPADSSGVAGYNYVWSQDPKAAVSAGQPGLLADARNASVRAEKDGTWYFRLAAQDYAGNWSEPATLAYTRDTTPPGRPRLILPPLDPEGYLQSNSFELDWQAADPGDAVGYAYNLDYRGVLEAQPAAPPLPATANTRGTRAAYANLDDGVWVFAVAALDGAGNRGEPAIALLPLNKYVPVTYISYVNERRDPAGTVDLTIGGRGFELGGQVGSVLLDRDGAPPYDYSFTRSSGAFRIVSDRLIRDLTLPDVEEGVYRVGVIHPERGAAWSGAVLRLERPGTVKFGDYSFVYSSPWQRVRLLTGTFGTNSLLALLAVAFLAVLSLASARRLVSLAQEGRLLRREVLAVLRGELPLARKVVSMAELKRRGFGLRWKYTALVMILVLLVVLMVSIPISIYMVDAQRQTMTEGLVQRVNTLLAGLSSTAANNLNPNLESVRQLNAMRDQVASTMAEAQFFTLTGYGLDDPGRFDYLWVSSDADVGRKAQGGRFDAGDYGRVRLEDEIAKMVDGMAAEVNEAARKRVAGLAEEADRLVTEATNLIRAGTGSPERIRRLEEEALGLSARIASELQDIRGKARSFPALDPEHPPQRLASSYLFYLPVVNQQRGEDVYYRGAVRLAVSTESIRAELSGSQRRLLIQSGIIALVAAGLGLIGAFIMAGITVGPIRKLMAGVVVVRDTEDKEQLKDFRIEVRTRDEIGELASQFTDMTHGLAKAAGAQKEMMVGKDIQRMFLPLAKDARGRIGSTAGEQNDLVEIFGYYEGAREVSGDFFDFRKLADRYYAMIKCDVSGKGVSAALIMVEVATIFATYFREWTPQNPGLKLQPLADQINDMVEERGFPGRFAALTLAILNAENGKLWLCNAGDTKQHIYRRAEAGTRELALPDAPACGVFPKFMVDAKGGFKQVPQQLATGDVLFLFTDGIEDGLGEVARGMKESEPKEAAKGGQPPASEISGHGMERIYAVIDAVLNRRVLKLGGHHNPLLEPELEFDFTSCSGSVEEAVLALVSVEKVLRLQPAKDAAEKDRVGVDRRVDAFLQKHYGRYGRYFTSKLEAGEEGETVTFTHLREDAQYDDLTILAIRKK